MRLLDLVVFYLLVGVGAGVLVARRGRRAPLDVALAVVLWPLVAPVALSERERERGEAGEHPEYRALCGALASVRDERLRAVLPTPEQLRPLATRLRDLERRVAELDEVMARGEFASTSEPEVRASLGRLMALREGAEREQRELTALCRRLRAQITVLRFAQAEAGDLGELVAELRGRLEGAQAAVDGAG